MNYRHSSTLKNMEIQTELSACQILYLVLFLILILSTNIVKKLSYLCLFYCVNQLFKCKVFYFINNFYWFPFNGLITTQKKPVYNHIWSFSYTSQVKLSIYCRYYNQHFKFWGGGSAWLQVQPSEKSIEVG